MTDTQAPSDTTDEPPEGGLAPGLVDDLVGDDVDDDVDDWDDAYVTVPEESGWIRKAAVVLVSVAVVVGLLFGGVWLWLQRQIDPPGDPGAEVTIEIPEGATTSQIARLLEENGVVSSATIFRFYAEWKEFDEFQAGVYDGLHERESMDVVLERLEAGPLPPAFRELTIPEGLWLADIVPLITTTFPEMDPVELTAALNEVRSRYQPADQPSLEGLLFPSTYQVAEASVTDEKALVTQLVAQMDATLDELGYADAAARVGLEPYQVLVIASLVEEEAKTDGDRAKISRVIHNRIADDMRLEIDATVPYALGYHKTELTQTDLEVDSPYNTRRYKGLPPTPIAAPGRASLEAALNPAEGPWIYYVLADADGNHFFTDDYDEFLDAKEAAQEAGLF